MIRRIMRFLTTDVWRIRLRTISRTKSFFIKQLRIFILSLRGFGRDRCQLRASALTFYSLLSIVPVFAMAFGIAKGFGFEKTLQEDLTQWSQSIPVLQNIEVREDIMARVIEFSQELLGETRGSVMAYAGLLVLFWTVIMVLSNIENSFNDIWGVRRGRSFKRRFTDYLSVMLVCPVLFIMSSSVAVAISAKAEYLFEKIIILGPASSVVMTLLKLVPYCVVWIIFSIMYIVMPNTRVRFRSGLVAGLIAGTIYQLVQFGYIKFQFGVARISAIYGTFAALPLLLVWLQLSWLIVLLGAEISFAHQNVETYEFEPDCLRVSRSFKRLITLRVVHVLVKNFCTGEKPWSAARISHVLEVPVRLVNDILYELSEAGIVSEANLLEDKSGGYQPARDVSTLTIKSVIDTLEEHGSADIPVARSREFDRISECLRSFSKAVEGLPENTLLRDI